MRTPKALNCAIVRAIVPGGKMRDIDPEANHTA